MRVFNTSGPNIPKKHYTLLRETLVQQGIQMVQEEQEKIRGVHIRTFLIDYDEEKDF